MKFVFQMTPGFVEEAGWNDMVRSVHGRPDVIDMLVTRLPVILGADPMTMFDTCEPISGAWLLFFRRLPRFGSELEFVVTDGLFTMSTPVEGNTIAAVTGVPSILINRIRNAAFQQGREIEPLLTGLMPVNETPRYLIAMWPSGIAEVQDYTVTLARLMPTHRKSHAG